jgi:hypothetical protein
MDIYSADTAPDHVEPTGPAEEEGDWITTTLPLCALAAYRRFAAVEELPQWLPVIHSVRVLSRNHNGRPERVSFLAELDRATIGYVLEYEYFEADLTIRFSTPEDAAIQVSGWARFAPLGHYASLMEYQLRIDRGTLPEWNDSCFANHAPSAVLYHFREHLDRTLH